MSCASCREIEHVDGAPPPCGSGECPIPDAGPGGLRVLRLRETVHALRDVAGAEAVLRMAGATWEDVELLAALESGLRERPRDEAEGAG